MIIASNLGHADDTEIFFSTGTSSEVLRPNVLFILDTSGSMGVRGSSGQIRMDELKSAMTTVLSTMQNVNVGLMRFNDASAQDGGPVLFPVSFIDGNVNNVVGDSGQNTVTEIVNTAFLQSGTDDGEENKSNQDISLTDITLDAFDFGGTQSVIGGTLNFPVTIGTDDSVQDVGGCLFGFNGMVATITPNFIRSCAVVGLRFTGVTIPQGANIGNAFLNLVIDRRQTQRTTTTIVGQDVGDASAILSPSNLGFGNINSDITNRPATSASVPWTIPAQRAGRTVQSPDIRTIIQEIVDRADWATGQNIFLRLENSSGLRRIRVHEINASQAPSLSITIPGSGTAVEGDDQMIALRFDELNIPQGATLNEATLTVTPIATSAGAESVWVVSAEQTDHSQPLQNSSANISNRLTSGTSVNWTVGSTDLITADTSEQSIDIKDVLQTVVNRPGWCGGNALTLILDTATATANNARFLHSRDSDSEKAPRLNYKFDVGQTGCVRALELGQTATSGDDAEQFGGNVDVVDDDLDIGFDSERNSNQTVGLRFTSIDVPKDATILSAEIEFHAKGISDGPATFTIKGIDEDNVVQFSNIFNDLTSRTTTSSSVQWLPEDWDVPAARFATSDITSIVQEIVSRSGWTSSNSMGFLIEAADGTRIAETADSEKSKSPRLEISYRTTLETPFKTNRQRLVELVNELPASGFTPIGSTMLEAANYWRGDAVDFGKRRNGNRRNRLSHPGSYCTAPGSCNGATINSSTDSFGVVSPANCNITNNPNSNRCRNRRIQGNPNYISPFQTDLTCATNHQVLLTDGAAFRGNSGNVQSKTRNKIGKSGCYGNNNSFRKQTDETNTYNGNERCIVDLVEFMRNEDQSTTLLNKQIVKTHTIGFDLSRNSTNGRNARRFITDVANVGGGDVYNAASAGDLVSVFESILTEVQNDPTSFVAPAISANAFNKIKSRDVLYFGLFTPNLAKSWHGNVKKYGVCVDSGPGGNLCNVGDIIDGNGLVAVDSTTNLFKDTAKDFWANSPGTITTDGRITTLGGTGHEIVNFADQRLYTDRRSAGRASLGQLLNESGFELTSNNWDAPEFDALRSSVCPSPSVAGGSDCETRMLWLLGKLSVSASDDTDINANQRWSVNDVLHSSAVSITYGGSGNTFIDKIIYSSNDGTLHFVNGLTGVEEWRFMPSDFWTQQQTLFVGGEGSKIYGLDVTPTVQKIDKNNNDIVEPGAGDKVLAYLASRRGGNKIYALDITGVRNVTSDSETVIPRFLWRIDGGTGDFTRLGQTWSRPVVSKILVDDGSGVKEKGVLIFGGGYDPALDNPGVYSPADNNNSDFLGNAIYIVDQQDGSLILSISGPGSGAHIQVADMQYSIPSDIRAIDSDGDLITDRLYVGDTGGQMWRVDLATLLTGTGNPENTTIVGKLADISDSSGNINQRRIFYPPSVIQVNDTEFANENTYDYILFGTGYRSHPLSIEERDRFYALRDFVVGTSEMQDADGDNVAGSNDGYPQISGSPYRENDLIDLTTTILDSSEPSHKGAGGWFFDFFAQGTQGEKVLSTPLTGNNVTTFTTFTPESASSTTADPCGASLGQGRGYSFNILSGAAAIDFDGDGNIDINDRSILLGAGIPSSVVPLFTNEGIVAIVGLGGGITTLGLLATSDPTRSHWIEGTDF